ncbi:MAG TPA: hypothetical protein VG961_08685 [Ignavibacteria bacterium]|nr:hypothetical protein [Ignavibacteria bacterium]
MTAGKYFSIIREIICARDLQILQSSRSIRCLFDTMKLKMESACDDVRLLCGMVSLY